MGMTVVVMIVIASLAVLFSGTRNAIAEGEKEYASYEEEIQAWIEWRDARLRRPDYYLSIVGLFPLEEGASTFGSDPSNDFVFPGKAPAVMGAFNLKDGVVTVEISRGVEVKHDGKSVTSMTLLNDRDEEGPTLLKLTTFTWFVIKRGDNLYVRVRDTESALLREFNGVERFPISEEWRVEGKVEFYKPDKNIPLQSTHDIVQNERVYGAVVFDIDGTAYRLDALGQPEATSLFIIFADETSAVETYGAGRYIYIDPPDENGKVFLDFNKAYNPPCAFNVHTTCPLPPPQNVLPIRVTVGEKTWEAPQ